jgi:DNA-binding transcriptional MerR regulator
MYTVKEVAGIAGVSVRTLHYYDEIGLLRPTTVGGNQYRYYDDQALLRLQQVLLYRDMGLNLGQIRRVLDEPGFDMITALREHRKRLEQRIHELGTLVQTVDETIQHMEKGRRMAAKELFTGFTPEKQEQYEREARLEYGPEVVNESIQRWKAYTPAEKETIMHEGQAIYAGLVEAIRQGLRPDDAHVQELMGRWHQHMRYFYEPPLEVLRGLGELYTTHPDFAANFAALHPQLAAFMQQAITHYVDALETQELERMLEADAAARRLQG